jgi:site-specific DNA-methyltransferase (adenine-specific)
MGTLRYGDNLDILRHYLKDETVDLVYLAPFFNSLQNWDSFNLKPGASTSRFGLPCPEPAATRCS